MSVLFNSACRNALAMPFSSSTTLQVQPEYVTVLAVLIVMADSTDLPETVSFIECAGALIRHPHCQRDPRDTTTLQAAERCRQDRIRRAFSARRGLHRDRDQFRATH